jgi:type I restriction enzyme R subunit
VLDLLYEARDIDQRLGSQEKIDAWFDIKTRGLNEWQRATLREQWGTMQKVLSSKARMDRVVADILFDFSVKPRLNDERGNAILVASSIYEACKYFGLFQKTPLKDRCAVVTSYNPEVGDITLEDTGANNETDKQFIYNTYVEVLRSAGEGRGMKTEAYEDRAKDLFKHQPARMKLLIVVDKLLTGFDAPPCTYLYIDKSMQDHGLFQAICRTNRLDGEEKDFGYIVDYKDLFKKVENAISVYTSELDNSDGSGVDSQVLLKDRLAKSRERLDAALEAMALLCEPVEPPKGELEHIHYFCGNTEIPAELVEREARRAALYKSAAGLVRAFANAADELEPAGYTDREIVRIKSDVKRYVDLREIVRKASGETLDLKTYEADMRHLIDTYIEAGEPRKISPFDNMPLLDLIVNTGIAEAINRMPAGIKSNKDAIAETIENNVRSKIIKENLSDPAFYDSMSKLLDEIITARRTKAIEYEEYLKRIADVAKRVAAGKGDDTPQDMDTPGRRALYNNLEQDQDLALRIDSAVRSVRPDAWRGIQSRENEIKRALYGVLQDHGEVERIFLIVQQQKEY